MTTCRQFPELLQTFFTDHLLRLRQASPHTIACYRDTFHLLVNFAHQRSAKNPTELRIEDLGALFIGQFLNHLETNRRNRPRSRNVRLAAIHSFFRYVALNEPAHLMVAQRVLAVPSKRFDRRPIDFLTSSEVDALLSAPNQETRSGRRDFALMLTAIRTGLRVSELTGLRCQDAVLGAGAHVRCQGKGRKERATPLGKETVDILKRWVRERNGEPGDPLFPNAHGKRLSQDGVAYILHKHVSKARKTCPSLVKKRISAHVLRHTLAMDLLHHGVDHSVIALWLGHESIETVQIYLHADMAAKEKALAKVAPSKTGLCRYRPNDNLLAFLKSL
jgi:integrase/recombinase XerD